MAKRSKADDGADESHLSNGFDEQLVPEYIGSIEELQEKIDTIMQAAKDECTPLRKKIADVKKASIEEDSIPRRELNANLQERRLLRKAAAVRANLSDNQKGNFDRIKATLDDLDDTPLGRSARQREGAAAQQAAA